MIHANTSGSISTYKCKICGAICDKSSLLRVSILSKHRTLRKGPFFTLVQLQGAGQPSGLSWGNWSDRATLTMATSTKTGATRTGRLIVEMKGESVAAFLYPHWKRQNNKSTERDTDMNVQMYKKSMTPQPSMTAQKSRWEGSLVWFIRSNAGEFVKGTCIWHLFVNKHKCAFEVRYTVKL